MTTKQSQIIDLWEGFEETEPDISTERLMEQVCQAARVDAGEVAEALHAPQSCQHVWKRLPGVTSTGVKIIVCTVCGQQIEDDVS